MGRLTPERRVVGRVLARFFERPGRLDRWLNEEGRELSVEQRRRYRAVLYAALRHQRRLAFLLSPYLPKALHLQRVAPRVALTVGATEIICMDGVPERAAVDQAVELCRDLGGKGQAGFVNAVLRRLARGDDAPLLPDREADPRRWAEVAASHPRWIVDEMAALVGPSEVAAWCAANQEEPPLVLTVPDPARRSQLAEELGATPTALSPWGLVVPPGAGAVDRLPGFADGWFWVQDEAAQLAAELVAAQPGERVLDACAAPGGKTLYLAARGAQVVATDSDARRLALVDGAVERVGGDVACRVRDWVAEPFGARDDDAPFDGVLIDAPCSGLGVIRRHPDIRWARRPSDRARYAERQRALLQGLAPAVKPGGRLVYAVCTFTAAETTGVLDAALSTDALGDFDRESVRALSSGAPPGAESDSVMRTLPHVHGADGFFAVALRRRT